MLKKHVEESAGGSGAKSIPLTTFAKSDDHIETQQIGATIWKKPSFRGKKSHFFI